MNIRNLLTTTEAAKLMGVTRQRIFQLAEHGELSIIHQIGKQRFYKRSDVERLKVEKVPRRPRGRATQ